MLDLARTRPAKPAPARHGVRDPVPTRHAVAFEAYADVCCPDDGGGTISKAFELVHHAIVAGARVAVAFPDMSSSALTGVGCRLRILGSAADVRKAVDYAQDDGLTLRAIAFVGVPAPVPAETRGGVAYVRLRDPGVGGGEQRRRDERARRRRKEGRCYMEEDDLGKRNRDKSALSNPVRGAPSLTVASGSTRKPFDVRVGRRSLPVEGGTFNSYGLSGVGPDGARGAVPDFA